MNVSFVILLSLIRSCMKNFHFVIYEIAQITFRSNNWISWGTVGFVFTRVAIILSVTSHPTYYTSTWIASERTSWTGIWSRKMKDFIWRRKYKRQQELMDSMQGWTRHAGAHWLSKQGAPLETQKYSMLMQHLSCWWKIVKLCTPRVSSIIYRILRKIKKKKISPGGGAPLVGGAHWLGHPSFYGTCSLVLDHSTFVIEKIPSHCRGEYRHFRWRGCVK